MIGQLCLDANLQTHLYISTLSGHHTSKRASKSVPHSILYLSLHLYTQWAPYKQEGIQECSTFNFIFIYNYVNEIFNSMN